MNIDFVAPRFGFTGSRKGMTVAQHRTFNSWAHTLVRLEQFHHGDCVGSDEQAHVAILHKRIPYSELHVHPPENPKLRAYCDRKHPAILGTQYVFVWPEAPYLKRNGAIVDASTKLVACPGSFTPTHASGTWWTIRHAQKTSKPVLVIYPSGSYVIW